MGCGLRRLRRSEESSPGKIYSTLRRPQVETKVGVAYTYRFLDFLLGNAEVPGWSTPCLSSVRELPGQLQDLYLEGFVLAALHPFVHPCGPPSARLQHQLYRAVLIRPNDRVEDCESRRLEMDVCQSPGQFPDTELIQGYVKKVHDAAEQGSMFVGFVQQVAMATAILGQGEGEELSLSLHSSPSSFLREEPHLNRDNPENQLSLNNNDQAKSPSNDREKSPSNDQAKSPSNDREKSPSNDQAKSPSNDREKSPSNNREKSPSNDQAKSPSNDREKSPSNNREKSLRTSWAKSPRSPTDPPQPSAPLERVELFSLFNHLGAQSADPARFYTVRVPLQLVWQDAVVTQVQAGWLDHMTQHFSSGASLVDGYFHLGNQHGNGAPPETVESVFVFQEGAESDPPTVSAFDAIVVEQWTVIHGVQVKTDYVPLLQSLALYGWRLTCVLPTPIAKSNSDGSLSTKQVLFLQRPS
ncbi:hypothetical protein AGOR_G00045210 [Albula goreensis]|uniref:Raftlin n=1 Tax=Albula goreensis TaxID=1534307 RepID=A0A8T3DZK1_9TELE|nr:hypothetical protein AGOR_G00045210 [Albula goreensis]